MNFRFPVFVVDKDLHKQTGNGPSIRALASAMEREGAEIQATTSFGDVKTFAQNHSRASAFLISMNDEEFGGGSASETESALKPLRSFISELRTKNGEVPIYLYGETRTSRHIPNDILKELHGFIHRNEDTPDFVAKHILREAKAYLESVVPPYFKALLNYTQNASYSWHCPGHAGGVAFLKSPVGNMFHKFFGENMLRSDVCNAVEELGQLLDHTGPVAASEKNAARIFNADHLFFVTNGTSTSNKIVWHSTVGPNDIVLVDRNCHKSNLHAIMMTGATPVYLNPTRNHHGIIGPIPRSEFSIETITKKIATNTFIADKTQKPRILTLTQSTYDGITYNVETIKQMLDGKVSALHFDEAWLPHAGFHDFYKNMHAIGQGRPRTKESIIYSTQSTHKTLAGLSQASQVLVNEAENKKFNHHIFNEAFMMHTSTSPLYSIIASCDVAAAMMEQPGGAALVEEALNESMDFRRAMRKVETEWTESSQGENSDRRESLSTNKDSAWWFKVWGPDNLPQEGIGSREDWILKPGEKWHGFGEVEEGFNMLDPLKATVLTPGLEINGEFSEHGVPAGLVSKYLAEHGAIVEKCGLYSFFIMFTIGITRGRWNTLLTALQQFKDDYDKNHLVGKVMPKFTRANPRYEHVGLRDLCLKIHEAYKSVDVARMTTEMYLSDMQPAMKPSEAFAKMAREEIERVKIDDLEGRVTAVLLTPYPPGIPLLVPGERFNASIVNYLKFAREFNSTFPGFETDTHGLVSETNNGVREYYIDCII